MELKNVSRYYPENMPYGDGIQYFQSEDGKDFYESLGLFTKKYKLCIDPETNIVCSIAEDASMLYPVGFDVVETDILPDGAGIHGDYQFINGEVVAREQSHDELIAAAETKKNRLLDEATTAIAPLQDAVELAMASDEEKEQLLAWKKYRILVNRVDTSTAPVVKWPEAPV